MDVNTVKQHLLDEYQKAKAKALQCVHVEADERALSFAAYAAAIAWQFPILPSYCDTELENLIARVAHRVLPDAPVRRVAGGAKRVVFYNGQIIDTGALTEQYLEYFFDRNYEVLLIVPYKANTKIGPGILRKVQAYEKGKALVLNEKNRLATIHKIYQAVVKFEPTVAFLHFLPSDVEGCVVFSHYQNCPRYYIVHNDHTFWLGKTCADYFLEFRQFGYNLSKLRRGIEPSKLVYLPFYPINSQVPLKNLPFDRAGKVVGLSGAILYKYFQDPSLQYFKQIGRLLNENPDFMFCLAGMGSVEQVQAIQTFIKENNLEGRFYYLGHRNDFFSLVGETDIYFESYPMKGGLSVLFAQNQKKAIVGLGEAGDLSGVTEDYFDLDCYQQPTSLEAFYKEAKRLIQEPVYRQANATKFACEGRFTKEYFDNKLDVIINSGTDYHELYTFKRRLPLFDAEKSLERYLYSGNVDYSLKMLRYRTRYQGVVTIRILDCIATLKHKGICILIKRGMKKIKTLGVRHV